MCTGDPQSGGAQDVALQGPKVGPLGAQSTNSSTACLRGPSGGPLGARSP